MNKQSELDCYLYFMWNAWSYDECIALFGENLGKHIWSKWNALCCDCGVAGAPAALYAALDEEKHQTLKERAVAYYNK